MMYYRICTLETYIILLTNVTLINLIKLKSYKCILVIIYWDFKQKKTAIMTFVTMSDNGVLQTRDNSLCQK